MLPERYVPRKISNVSKSDKKVSVIGKIVDVKADSNSFVLADETSDEKNNVEIILEKDLDRDLERETGDENPFNLEKVEKEKGKLVRAFCTLIGERLKLDVLQPLDGLDLNLSKTVDELYEKAGV
jgi:hypothetical protein